MACSPGMPGQPGATSPLWEPPTTLLWESKRLLSLAEFVLKIVRQSPGCPILMLVDTQGQRLSKRDEFLGINGYLAHLVKCLELARLRGHQLLTLVYAEAVSGGFLAFGLMADEIHTLAEAKVRVMNLPAMARITKLPLDKLEELSLSSPVLCPRCREFLQARWCSVDLVSTVGDRTA